MARDLHARLDHLKRLHAAVAHISLMPCPFCGADARLSPLNDYWHVTCTNVTDCDASGPWREQAVDAANGWNRRTSERALAAAAQAAERERCARVAEIYMPPGARGSVAYEIAHAIRSLEPIPIPGSRKADSA